MTTKRVIAYIDGYNLYHGLRDARLQSSRWLDLRAMCESLLKPDQHLEFVRYFTTRVRNDPAAEIRQSTFIDALLSRGGIEIDFGHFLSKGRQCFACGHQWQQSEEKKTDVNIAVRLLDDAYDDRFDTAIVISGTATLCRQSSQSAPDIHADASSWPFLQSAPQTNFAEPLMQDSRFRTRPSGQTVSPIRW